MLRTQIILITKLTMGEDTFQNVTSQSIKSMSKAVTLYSYSILSMWKENPWTWQGKIELYSYLYLYERYLLV